MNGITIASWDGLYCVIDADGIFYGKYHDADVETQKKISKWQHDWTVRVQNLKKLCDGRDNGDTPCT